MGTINAQVSPLKFSNLPDPPPLDISLKPPQLSPVRYMLPNWLDENSISGKNGLIRETPPSPPVGATQALKFPFARAVPVSWHPPRNQLALVGWTATL